MGRISNLRLMMMILLIVQIQTLKHPSIFDEARNMNMIQTRAENDQLKGEVKFGHLSLQEALDLEIEDCTEDPDYSQWVKQEIVEWIEVFQTIDNNIPPAEGSPNAAAKQISDLQKSLELKCSDEKLLDEVPRGTTEFTDLSNETVFTYQKSCIMNLIDDLDEDELIDDPDTCRHLLKSIDDILSNIEFITNIGPEQKEIYEKKLKDQSNRLCCDKECDTCFGPDPDQCLTCNENKGFDPTPNSDNFNTCQCKPGFYYNFVSRECDTCPFHCKTCSEIGECDTCQSTRLQPEVCSNCAPQQFERSSDDFRCYPCHYTCKTCKEEGEFGCVQCHENRESIDGKCVPKPGWFEIPGTGPAAKCHYTCQVCEIPEECARRPRTCFFGNEIRESKVELLKHSCTVCDELQGRVLNSDNECVCMLHQGQGFDQEPALMCQNCDKSCVFCATNEDNDTNGELCSICAENRDFVEIGSEGNGSCKCKEGYYSPSTAGEKEVEYPEACEQCDDECETCGQKGSCATCKPNMNQDKVNGQCECDEGVFVDKQCKPCHPTCGKNNCTGIEATECKKDCPKDRVYNAETGECEPEEGHFENNEEVPGDCNIQCLTCVGPLDNDCNSCRDEQTIEDGAEVGACICKDNEYRVTDLSCAPCLNGGLTCNEVGQPLTCEPGKEVKEEGIQMVCKEIVCTDDQAKSIDGLSCIDCHVNCEGCTGGAADECKECSGDLVKVDDLCVCPDQQHQIEDTNQCKPCQILHCKKCSSDGSTCIIPMNPDTQVIDEKITCPKDNEVFNEVTGQCDTCSDPLCNECKESTIQCTKCNGANVQEVPENNNCVCVDDFEKVNDECQPKCEDNQFRNNDNDCQDCNPSCTASCTGPGEDQCSDCPVGEKLDSTSNCVPCNPSCAECTTIECTKCKVEDEKHIISLGDCICDSAKGFIVDPENSMYCTCPEDLVEQDGSCQPCNIKCKTCSGIAENECLTCDETVRQYNALTKTCDPNDGTFEGPNGQIEDCNQRCRICKDTADQCEACHDNTFNYDEVAKTCSCEEGTVQVTNNQIPTCVECSINCKTCDIQPTNCIECKDENAVKGANNECKECIEGFFHNSESAVYSCEECDPTCMTCSGETAQDCLECYPEEFKRTKNDATGECEPIPGTYENKKKEPGQCHPMCKTCTGPINDQCSECYTEQGYVKKDKTAEVSSCVPEDGTRLPETIFEEGCEDTNSCKPKPTVKCHLSCEKCTNPGDVCDECKAGRIHLDNGKCQCPENTFDTVLSHNLNKCEQCDSSCKTCSKIDECLTCDLANYRVKEGKLCRCKDGYIENVIWEVCVECHYKCLTCSVDVTCIICHEHRNIAENCAPDDGYYEEAPKNIPPKCHYTCKRCNGPEQDQCTECDPKFNREPVPADTEEHECPPKEGFYDPNVNETPQTYKCHYHCKTCENAQGPEFCTACNEDNNFIDKPVDEVVFGHKCKPKPGHYDDPVQETAPPCHASCETCNGEAETQCLICKKHDGIEDIYQNELMKKFGESGICLPICDPKDNNAPICHYHDPQDESKKPMPCDDNCKTCEITSTNCTVCKDNQQEITTGGVCKCKKNYWFLASMEKCLACDKGCECDYDTGECERCKGEYAEIDEKTGLCECREGYDPISLSSIHCKRKSVPSTTIPEEIPSGQNCITMNYISTPAEYEEEFDAQQDESSPTGTDFILTNKMGTQGEGKIPIHPQEKKFRNYMQILDSEGFNWRN